MSERSIAPPLQKTDQNREVAFFCTAIACVGASKAKKHGQTDRVFSDGAIVRLHVVDADMLRSKDAVTAGQLARANRRRRPIERECALANHTKQNDCPYTQRVHDV